MRAIFVCMNHLEKKISEIAEEVSGKLGFLLIDVTVKGDNRNRIVQIFVDSDTGLSTDDCALVSSEAASLIESSDLIPSKYRLEVSSPGIDRPLKYLRQFFKHINRKFEITYFSGNNDTAKVNGKLVRIEDSDLIFLVNGNEIKINHNQIKIAKVLVSF